MKWLRRFQSRAAFANRNGNGLLLQCQAKATSPWRSNNTNPGNSFITRFSSVLLPAPDGPKNADQETESEKAKEKKENKKDDNDKGEEGEEEDKRQGESMQATNS